MSAYIKFDYVVSDSTELISVTSPNNNSNKNPSNKNPTKNKPTETYIGNDGLLHISGSNNQKRYLRLGKISLFDAVKSTCITNEEYIGILDTLTGQLMCVDTETIRKNKDNDIIKTKHVSFTITPEIRNAVNIELINNDY